MKKTNMGTKTNMEDRKKRSFFHKISGLHTYSILILKLFLALALFFTLAVFINAAGVIVEDGALNVSNDLLVNTNTLYVNSTSNNIGIGTASPTAKLVIDRGSSGDAIILQNNGSDTQGYLTSIKSAFDIGTITNDPIRFFVNSAEKLIIQNVTGNVGIGTSTPTLPFISRPGSGTGGTVAGKVLQIRHTTGSTDNAAVLDVSAGSVEGFLASGFNGRVAVGSLSSHDFWLYTGNLSRVVIDTSGKVGINTSTPSYPLHVSGDVSGISLYVSANVSALGYTDRTPFPDDGYDALSDIRSIRSDGNGNIDHTTLPIFAQASYQKPIYETTTEYDPETEKGATITEIIGYEEEKGRNIGGMISINTVAIQQLLNRVETLEDELCSKDNSYSWCR